MCHEHEAMATYGRQERALQWAARIFGALPALIVGALIAATLACAFLDAFDREAHMEDLRAATGAQPYQRYISREQ